MPESVEVTLARMDERMEHGNRLFAELVEALKEIRREQTETRRVQADFDKRLDRAETAVIGFRRLAFTIVPAMVSAGVSGAIAWLARK